jgi:hypothetical protein
MFEFAWTKGENKYFASDTQDMWDCWQAAERELAERAARLEKAMTDLIDWLDNDTLEIMKDTMRMGITFDQKDCELLREEIEKARRALAGEEKER